MSGAARDVSELRRSAAGEYGGSRHHPHRRMRGRCDTLNVSPMETSIRGELVTARSAWVALREDRAV
jgi:hypothetical protein